MYGIGKQVQENWPLQKLCLFLNKNLSWMFSKCLVIENRKLKHQNTVQVAIILQFLDTR